MLSKEEIEKARENITKYLNDIWFGTLYSQEENDRDEKILLEYIEQLESDNYELNNRINDYIEERRELIEKLEENVEELEILHDNYIDANIVEGTYETLGRISKAKEILSILKGEKE